MSEMVERAIVGLADIREKRRTGVAHNGCACMGKVRPTDPACRCLMVILEEDVRAVLAAIREPTETMVAKAISLDDEGSSIYGEPHIACSHEEAWHAMIDEALK